MSHRDSACEGKKRFETMTQARKAARRSSRSKKHRGGSAYHCLRCNGFHIGSYDKRGKLPDRRREILEREGLR